MTQWITCNIDGEFCPFQRVCHETKSIINTTQYVLCPNLVVVEEKPIVRKKRSAKK
jgi:hypothetical protein